MRPVGSPPLAPTLTLEGPDEGPEMALVDRLNESPQVRHTGHPCSMAVLLDRLDDSERTALDAMMYELRWSGAKIHATLKAEGYEVGQQTVNRHRAKACRCFR